MDGDYNENWQTGNIYEHLRGDPIIETGPQWKEVNKNQKTANFRGVLPEYEIVNFVSNPDSTYNFDIQFTDGTKLEIRQKDIKELSKLPHELVIWSHTGIWFQSDVHLEQIFPEWVIAGETPGTNEFGNIVTPDAYDGKYFFEYKTTRNVNDTNSRCETTIKKFRNKRSRANRRSLNFKYCCICVSPEKISIGDLEDNHYAWPSQEKGREMCSMVLLGHAILSDLMSVGVDTSLRDNAFKARLMEELTKIHNYATENPIKCKEEDRKYMINEDLIQFYLAHPEMPMEEVYWLWRESQSDFVKACKPMTESEIMQKFDDIKMKFRHKYDDHGMESEKKRNFKAAIHLPMFIGKPSKSIMNNYADMEIGEYNIGNAMTKLYREGIAQLDGRLNLTHEEMNNMESEGIIGAIKDYESGRMVREHGTKRGNLEQRRKEILKMNAGKTDPLEDEDVLAVGSTDTQTRISREAIRKRGEQYKFMANLDEQDWIDLAMRGVESKRYNADPFMIENKKMSKIPFDFDLTDLSPIDKFVRTDQGLFQEELIGPKILSKKFQKIFDDYKETRDKMLGKNGLERKNNMSKENKSRRDKMTAEFYLRRYDQTKLSSMLQTFTLMIGEVATALNQLCVPGEFMLKRMNSIGAYLLIKPNKIDGHISFSVLTKRENTLGTDFSGVFESWKTYNDNWVYSEFCSVNKHRLSHYLNANELFCLVALHLQQIFRSDLSDTRIQKHLLGQVLLGLESKTPTVIVTLLSRYMYMEAIKTGLTVREPYKILTKFPEFFRSPYSLWCARNIIDAAQTMCVKNPKMVVEESDKEMTGDDTLKSIGSKMKHLVSWVTQEEIDDIEQMLYLSYMGVFRNKDEGDPNQGNFTIFGKIMTEELKLYDKNADWLKLGHSSDRENIPHSFRVDTVTSCGKALIRFLERKYGRRSVTRMMEDNMVRRSKKTKWDDFATFSASAVPPKSDDWTDHMMENQKKNKSMNKRAKVVNTVLGMLTGNEPRVDNCSFESMMQAAEACGYEFKIGVDELSPQTFDRMKDFHEMMGSPTADAQKFKMCAAQPFQNISEIFKITHDRGYIMANVFKKAQHTGPREIFVLSLDSRITINLVENMSRSLCDLIPSEMLTKGQKKLERIEDFFQEISKERKRHKMPIMVTETDSDDKATWCQQFMMKVFSCLKTAIYGGRSDFLDMLLRVENHILNLVTNKKLELPFEMLKDFFEKNSFDYTSFVASVRELKNQFLSSNGPHTLIEYEKIFLRNLSNMMQGILHYTSSLLHACFSLYSEEIEKRLIDASLSQIPGNANGELAIHLGTLWSVSSDDSLNVRCIGLRKPSFFVGGSNESLIKWSEVLLSCLSFFNRRLGRWACMVYSYEKSTGPSFNGVMEFNSCWKVFSNTLLPTVKFIYAAMNLKTTQEMLDRQRSFSESRKQILENGGKIVECELADILQCKVNYKMLGLDTNKWFSRYWNLCKQLKCPSLGYYVPELEHCNGMASFTMNYCLLAGEVPEASKSLSYLYRKADNEYSENGTPTIGVTLAVGGTSNYKYALSKMKPPPDFEATVENDKTFLFRGPENVLESLTMIFKKLESSGAVNAFSFNSPYKMFVAGVYCLQSASVTIRMKSPDGWIKYWSSLLGMTIHMTNQILGNCTGWKSKSKIIKSREYFTDENFNDQLDKIFPGRESFLRLRESTTELYSYDLVRLKGKLRQTKKTVLVNNKSFQTTAGLTDCLKHIWFPGRFPKYHTNEEINQSLAIYRSLYKWIAPRTIDIEMNSERCPFSGWMNFRDMLQSTEVKPNKVFALSAARGLDSDSTWFNICRVTASTKYILAKPGHEAVKMTKKVNRTIGVKLEVLKDTITLTQKLDFVSGLISKYSSSPDSLGEDHTDNLRALLSYVTVPSILSLDPEAIKQLTRNQIAALLLHNICVSGGSQSDFAGIINCFESNYKLGLQYRFVKEQEQNDAGQWMGDGDVRMFLDGRPLKIVLFDDEIRSISVKNFDLFLANSHLINRVIGKRFGVTKADFQEAEWYLDLETGHALRDVIESNRYCPVYINTDLSSTVKHTDTAFKINVNFGKSVEIMMCYNDKWVPIYTHGSSIRYESIPVMMNIGYLNKGINEFFYKDIGMTTQKIKTVITKSMTNDSGKEMTMKTMIDELMFRWNNAHEDFISRVKREKKQLAKQIDREFRRENKYAKSKFLTDPERKIINDTIRAQWKRQHWAISNEKMSLVRSAMMKKFCLLQWIKMVLIVRLSTRDRKSKLIKNGRKLEESDLASFNDANDRTIALLKFLRFENLSSKEFLIRKKSLSKISSGESTAQNSEEGSDSEEEEINKYVRIWNFYNNVRMSPHEFGMIRSDCLKDSMENFKEKLISEDRYEDAKVIMEVNDDTFLGIFSKLCRDNEAFIMNRLKNEVLDSKTDLEDERSLMFEEAFDMYFRNLERTIDPNSVDWGRSVIPEFESEENPYSMENILEVMKGVSVSSSEMDRALDFDIDDYLSDKSTVLKLRAKNCISLINIFNKGIFESRSEAALISAACGQLVENDGLLEVIVKLFDNDLMKIEEEEEDFSI